MNALALVPMVLGAMVVVALLISKYVQQPALYFLAVVLGAVLYQRGTNRAQRRTGTFEETLINVSKFVIVTGIAGYLVMKTVGLFLPGFD